MILDVLLDPENISEVDAASRSSLAQGIEALAMGFEESFADWSSFVKKCTIPILICFDSRSDIHDLADVERFASDCGGNIEVRDMETESGMLFYGSVPQLVEVLKSR